MTMALSECNGCDTASVCTAQRVFETIWSDSGEEVTEAQVARALDASGLARGSDCQALVRVDELQEGVLQRVEAQMATIEA